MTTAIASLKKGASSKFFAASNNNWDHIRNKNFISNMKVSEANEAMPVGSS